MPSTRARAAVDRHLDAAAGPEDRVLAVFDYLDQLAILANGAMVLAGISGTPDPARQAREAARLLIDAS